MIQCGNNKSKVKNNGFLKSTTIKQKVNACTRLTTNTFFSKTSKGRVIPYCI